MLTQVTHAAKDRKNECCIFVPLKPDESLSRSFIGIREQCDFLKTTVQNVKDNFQFMFNLVILLKFGFVFKV